MEHYSMEKWIDFVRDVVGAQEKTAMQIHLGTGCKQCTKVLSLWRHVHEVAQYERHFEPPQSAVRSMKGTFAIHGPRNAHRGARAIAELLFDSSRNPLPAGVRSSGSNARQLLFGIGEYRIDLRLEPQFDSEKVAVVGQVLHSTDPTVGLGAVPVALVKGHRVVAESVTSRFGEFNLECDATGRFHLRVKLPSEELQVALIEPILAPGADRPLVHDSKEISKLLKQGKKRNRKRV
jgi:hypothetical protein